MISDNIKELRHGKGLTQGELAKLLGVTRSCVNAWEMGISDPRTTHIIQMSKIFHTTTDCILGVSHANSAMDDYTTEERRLICGLLTYIDKQKQK